mmetsp:Transcript_46595/g.123057  ORF Transcript_46595/g.123057 Transcript_46595/m.123057 type:complete len:258 (+) Transcript_46595:337-1110(+)
MARPVAPAAEPHGDPGRQLRLRVLGRDGAPAVRSVSLGDPHRGVRRALRRAGGRADPPRGDPHPLQRRVPCARRPRRARPDGRGQLGRAPLRVLRHGGHDRQRPPRHPPQRPPGPVPAGPHRPLLLGAPVRRRHARLPLGGQGAAGVRETGAGRPVQDVGGAGHAAQGPASAVPARARGDRGLRRAVVVRAPALLGVGAVPAVEGPVQRQRHGGGHLCDVAVGQRWTRGAGHRAGLPRAPDPARPRPGRPGAVCRRR